MAVPGSCQWNFGIGLQPGEVEKDDEGIRTMKILSENMGWLLKQVEVYVSDFFSGGMPIAVESLPV